MIGGRPSLKARLIVGPLLFQFLAIAAAALGFISFFYGSNLDGMYAEDAVVHVAAEAIVRDQAGKPVIRVTPDLAKLRKDAPDLWFTARLEDGAEVTFGQVPAAFAHLASGVDQLASADLRGEKPPYLLSAVVRSATGPAGRMKILAHGRVQPFSVLITTASNIVAATLFVVMALVSVIAIPLIVRRALAGVINAARQAENIHAEQRGMRLSEGNIPREIVPLVRAVNDALGRLDDFYERQSRFIASAAHELRTPIAILRMKVNAASDRAVRALSSDVARLSNLSEQLLDLHRLDNGAPTETIDLAMLARSVAADLAPILIAAEKTIEVLAEQPGSIEGNSGSIERTLTNLIQNAVEHGGDQVTVRIDGTALEVEDNGAGIPSDEHDRVFEPFHRLKPRSSGVGLGLNLVLQVVERHGGRVTIADAPNGGTIVRVSFPVPDRPR
jgi:signal transduction histidine kinase